jgi:hypothetical protein
MGKVTKIMLGLNILAGIAGIVFGMGVKGNLKAANEAKGTAEAKAKLATGGTSKLQSDNQKLSSDLQLTQGQLAQATNELAASKQTLSSVQGDQGQLAQELQKANGDLAQLQSQFTQVQNMAKTATLLQQEIQGYKQIGSLPELQALKANADKAAKAAVNKNKKNKSGTKNVSTTRGADAGAIVSFDPKFGFYVINRGSDHGIKAAQEFNVIRAGRLVGKIKIQQPQPTVSIANAVKEFTRQQLQPGDKLGKSD